MLPASIKTVVVASHDALPLLDELLEGVVGAVGMQHEEGRLRAGHRPQPVPPALGGPGGFVDVVDLAAAGDAPDEFVVGRDGDGGAVDHPLEAAETHRQLEKRVQKSLNRPAAVAVNSAEFSDQGVKTRAVAVAEMLRNLRLDRVAACQTAGRMKMKMGHLQRNFREFDMLMGVKPAWRSKALRAARAALRTQVLLPVGLEKLRATALVPHDPASASAALAGGASATSTGTVGGGRPAAVAAVTLQTLAHLGQLRLQTPDAPTQLVNLPSKTAHQAPKPG